MPQHETVASALAGLKDFQRRTVDYVFDRLYGSNHTTRFLVADEVGLGKTLVARGVIARAYEHLRRKKSRIDVIYVCSNAAIQTQNVNRLNLFAQPEFSMATRLTLLPAEVHRLARNRVNFISLTPGTAFDLKSRCGRADERALLCRILLDRLPALGPGIQNLLQGGVGSRERWMQHLHETPEEIDDELASIFCTSLKADQRFFRRLSSACKTFRRHRVRLPWVDQNERDSLVGELRLRLANTSLSALKPDLVILDEFQRFRDLLDNDTEEARLASALFRKEGARVLLLSATPYKLVTLNHDRDDDHYPDFIRTMKFLLQDEDRVQTLKHHIADYRRRLLSAGRGEVSGVESAKERVQQTLSSVMCRTERVSMTKRLDSMLIEPEAPASLRPVDLRRAAVYDRTATLVGAREPIEYWKSSPFLLNFLKDYDLRRKLDSVADLPTEELLSLLRRSKESLLQRKTLDGYKRIDSGNPRMRVLLERTLDRGLWRLLWLPPSLPYYKPEGHYSQVGDVSKALVFSSWTAVPEAIAAFCSYEAERRMVAESGLAAKHSNLGKQVRALLKFSKGQDKRLTGMPVVAWLFPSPTLAASIDPLKIALKQRQKPAELNDVLNAAVSACERLLEKLPPGKSGPRVDERWYWAAPALLERASNALEWSDAPDGWRSVDTEHEPGELFVDHLHQFVEAGQGELDLGPRPDDLAKVLAELALAGPGTCALRALQRIAPDLASDDSDILSAAARVAAGFRSLFNVPESIGLLRADAEESYWRTTLQYALSGNLQALLDEQVHVLVEQLGLSDHADTARAEGISRAMADALSIRSVQVRIDELRASKVKIRRGSFNTRCRLALRFGALRDDTDSTRKRVEVVREAFNSPFRPFILASTSIGQEGLDFHTWCHSVVHWNLPSNPVDLEQREGRVHRYKGHAVRKNIAQHYGLGGLQSWDSVGDPWAHLFSLAKQNRQADATDIVPYWVFESGDARIERIVPLLPFSREVGQLQQLKQRLALYRLVFGQPRQEDLLSYLSTNLDESEIDAAATNWRISLEPPAQP